MSCPLTGSEARVLALFAALVAFVHAGANTDWLDPQNCTLVDLVAPLVPASETANDRAKFLAREKTKGLLETLDFSQ